MKKIYKAFIILGLSASFSLCSCSFLSGFSFPDNSSMEGEETGETYEDHFTDTNGKVHYVALDKKDVYLLPGMSAQIIFDMYLEGESPSFDINQTGSTLKWRIDDSNIASIKYSSREYGNIITAKNVGETKLHATLFASENVGTNAKIHVVDKELTSISIKSPKTTYALHSTFKPAFKLMATYSGVVEEEVPLADAAIDSSAVNMEVEGTYTVNVSYTLDGVTKHASYNVKVVDNPTYDPESLNYTYNDVKDYAVTGRFCPRQGDVKTLVLPVWFTDSSNYIDSASKTAIRSGLETAFYGEGNPSTGWNSVASYYYQTSGGKLRLAGNVADWYNSTYAITDFNTDADSKIRQVVIAATDDYFASHIGEDPHDYDYDNNGVFDGIYVIYGCPDSDESHPSIPKTFWGKISFTQVREATVDMPAIRFYMWASAFSLYESPAQEGHDPHVFTHEFGHTLGLSDYYDYGENKYYAIGGGIMMFHNTHEQDPFSTLSLGYSKVIVPETSCTIDLADYQSSGTTILLSNHPESVNSPFDEYILIELYSNNGTNKYDHDNQWKGGYIQGPNEPGIRIWHVDARLAYENSSSYSYTTDPTTPGSFVAFTNTWGENHGTKLGREYDDYCLLFDVRNSKTLSYTPKNTDPDCMFKDAMLFHAGDTFSISDYSNQFVRGNKLNSGEDLGWTINIESIVDNGEGGYTASINLEYDF